VSDPEAVARGGGRRRRYRGSKVPSELQGQSPWWRLRGKAQRKRGFGGGAPRIVTCFDYLTVDVVFNFAHTCAF